LGWADYGPRDGVGPECFPERSGGGPARLKGLYCAEPFGEDVAPITTIIKHLKRVVAGEYSRELSERLSRAKRQQARLGFRQGGKLTYGFRRLLVDPARNPRQILNSGERKALSSDKVIVIPGPPEELAVIRRIFRLYVRDQLSIPEVTERLASAGVKSYDDKPLAARTIRNILSNELCIGQMTYNITTRRLQGRKVRNPEQLWTRFSAFEPIIPVAQFRKAHERLSRFQYWTKEAITASLKSLLARKGRLTQILIRDAEGAPCADTVTKHFGSLPAAYAAVGYEPPATPPFGMNGKYWSKKAVLTGLQKLHAAEGYTSTRLILSFPGLPSVNCIRRRFGSIPEAMRQAGLPVLSLSQIQRRNWKRLRVRPETLGRIA
jgi:recombinase